MRESRAMSRRAAGWVAGVAVLIATLVACGAGSQQSPSSSGTPAPTATATPAPTAAPTLPATPVVGSGAADPVTAVKDVTNDGGTNQFCQHSYAVSPCPVTERFGDRLDSNPFSAPAGGAAPICRCQNAPQMTYTLISQSGDWAYVGYDIGAGAPTLRFTVLDVGGSWYVDDQDLGCAQTSIYNPGYDAVTSTTATPGPTAPSGC